METLAPPTTALEAPLLTLDRMIEKYRRDVNHLRPGASVDAVQGLQRHLGVGLPSEYARFLAHHDGATLLRGGLRIRSASEVALASEGSAVVLFADAVGASAEHPVAWAWVPCDEAGTHFVYGTWTGEVLEPLYSTFAGFLAGELAVLEEQEGEAHERRLTVAGADPWQRIDASRRARQSGDPEAALRWLEPVTVAAPGCVAAWIELGRAHAARGDDAQAQQAWLAGLERAALPVGWPGEPTVPAEVVHALAVAAPEGWLATIDGFLDERVDDVCSDAEAALLEAAGLARATALERTGRRSEAGEALEGLLVRMRDATHPGVPWAALLRLVDVHIGLGHHDAAESLLRQVRRHGPPALQPERLLRQLEIVVLRQEPWAADLGRELDACALSAAQAGRARLLRVERAVRLQRTEEVEALLDDAEGAEPAHVAMARGDVCRQTGDLDAAERRYLEGLELRGDAAHDELALRIRLRLADVYRRRGDLEAAHELATEVVEGFSRLRLPVREAWALVRVAQVVMEAHPGDAVEAERAAQLRHAARERFRAADLAAGVAAVDSLAGEPGASLAWHLERASAQARSRHDAQRSRPPLTREDADRPERRLGAHRLAIAACDDGIVRALSQQMDACVRATRATAGRPTEPPVLRYVAAVDLLCGHRSYDAAKVLLDHLFTRGLDGVMQRALQGAIARSPNAALVDGLLRCVEAPTRTSPLATAAAAEVLGLRRERAALGPLVALLEQSGATAARKAALVALGRIGEREVVEALVPSLQDPRLAEPAALSLLMLGDRRGVDFHGRALTEQRNDLSGSPGEIVGRYGGPDHLLLLIQSSDGEGARALGALQGLGLLGDPRGVRALLRALRAPARRVVEVASGALQILTGHEEDAMHAGVRGRWQTWWDAHAQDFPEGVRHRRGQVFDCGLLIDDMTHHDAYVRRTAYDELVIASGEGLPFDADGPWRVQCAHLRAWREWWGQATLEPGRWTLDGRMVG